MAIATRQGQGGSPRAASGNPGHFGRLVTAGLLLGVVWVAVYWWWPAEPAVSFASGGLAAGSDTPIVIEGAESPAGGAASTAPGAPFEARLPESASPTWPKAGGAGAPSGDASTTIAGVRPPGFLEHTIAQGDTPESISRAFFGTPLHADAILRANPQVSPTNLRVGRVVRVPKDPANIQGVPTTRPATASDHTVTSDPPRPATPEQYVVQKGDSLGKIAKRIYADERLATLLFDANRDQLDSPDKVRVGQVLRVPPKPKD
jgi:nucleoid-associated protein YgaU